MKRMLRIMLIALLCILGALGAAAGIYVYRNMNYDRGIGDALARAGFAEKQTALADGTVLNYGEGPDGGPPLLLIHGQMVDWRDYHRVLPELAKSFHVYAVDCHGHGGSSKEPAKYQAAAMGEDMIEFITSVIGEPCYLSGHSSGGILAAYVAAKAPEQILGALLEDPPLFATEPGRCEETYAWLDGFRTIHNFLNQQEEPSYPRYYLENCYLQTFFGEGWAGIKRYALGYMDSHPGEQLRVFFLQPSMNKAFDLLYGPYDLRFGDAFYDCSWFEGVDQAGLLAQIRAPVALIHASWQYNDQGVLLAAMDGDDAARANALMPGSRLVNIQSGHNVHDERPAEFLKVMRELAAH